MNEKFEVLTVHDIDFMDPNNRPVQGMQLWLIHESAEPAWNGYEVMKTWIPDGHLCETIVSQLRRGDLIEIQWDRRGKPVQIELVR